MLYIVATPIGNLEDMTPRGLAALKAVSVIACEDTRRTWALLSSFGIPRPVEMISYREGNEDRQAHAYSTCCAAERMLRYARTGVIPG